MRKITGLLVAALALAAAVWAQGALSINGAGATFPYPMYSKWFDEYHKKNGNLQINYQPIGSVVQHSRRNWGVEFYPGRHFWNFPRQDYEVE